MRKTVLEAAGVYAVAVLIGIAAALLTFPIAAITGGGPGWALPAPDQAQALTGHLAFQADAWRWPLLQVDRLFVPHGISLALVDSNALVSLLAKAWVHAFGGAPINALGAFLAACWVLQPVGAAYAARGLRVGWLGALVAALLAAAWPALLFRTMHVNLCAHALILFALGMAVRRLERQRSWVPPGLLLLLAVLTHPYLFELCAAVLAAVPVQAALRRRAGWLRDVLGYAAGGVLAVGVLVFLAGPLGGGDKGFTFFSMNLLSPVWPQLSGVFGAGLPIVDATGGQYEGFDWLGAGTMLLLLSGLVAAAVRRSVPRPPLGLVLVLAALTLIALSSRVYAGQVKLLDLGDKPWEDIFGSFRSSGRAFWPVGYALMLAGVVMTDRLGRGPGTGGAGAGASAVPSRSGLAGGRYPAAAEPGAPAVGGGLRHCGGAGAGGDDAVHRGAASGLHGGFADQVERAGHVTRGGAGGRRNRRYRARALAALVQLRGDHGRCARAAVAAA